MKKSTLSLSKCFAFVMATLIWIALWALTAFVGKH